MSYILDALKKAEAQRERGAVPGLHSQAIASAAGAPARVAPAGLPPWAWGVAVALVLGLGAVAWLNWGGAHEPAPAPVAVPAAAMPPPIMAPAASSVAAPAPLAMPVPTTAPTAAQPMRPPPVVAPTQPSPSPSAQTAAAVARPAAARTAPGPASAVGQPAETRIYQIQELPDDIRRELPTLAISGSVYSGDAASRMLVINGQVFHERDTVAPGLLLAQIRLKAAVLEYRGYRYSIAY